jgi:hypothetical protein
LRKKYRVLKKSCRLYNIEIWLELPESLEKLKRKISGLITGNFLYSESSKCIKNVPELWHVGMP